MLIVKILRSTNKVLIKSEELLIVVGTIICILATMSQIVFRYLLNISVPWTEEVARFAFVWICWLACAHAMTDNSHIDITLIDTFIKKMKNSEKIFRVLRVITLVVSVTFLFVFLNIYWQFYDSILHGKQYSVVLKLHYSVPMGSLVVGCALMIFHGLYNLIPGKYE